jgi:hypothetical protein
VSIGTLALLAGLLLFLTSLALLGDALRQTLKAEATDPLERLLWNCALGTAAAAALVSVAGLSGLYRLPFFLALLAAGPLFRLLRAKKAERTPTPPVAAGGEGGAPHLISMAGLLLCTLAVLTGTLLPETFYDALYYHLGLPSQYLQAGRIAAREAVVHSAFPASHDSLLGVLLALGGAPMARLFSCVLYLFGGGATCLLGRLLFGTGGGTAAFLLLSVPGVIIMSSMTNVDTAMIWYSSMVLAGTARALKCRGRERRRWAVMTAIPLGMVVGSKYTGLMLLPVPVLALLADSDEEPKEKLLSSLALAGTALLLASPWYLRNLLVYGNPFFPAFDTLFGPTPEGAWALEKLKSDLPRLSSLLRTPSAFREAVASGRLPLGAGAELGLGTILALPATVVAFFLKQELRPFLGGILVFLGLWAISHPAVRYLYPVFPFFAASGGWGIAALVRNHHLLRPAAALFLAAVLIASLLTAGEILTGQFGGVRLAADRLTGRISAEDYLSLMLPYHETARWINANLPEDAKILFLGETRVLYVQRLVSFASAYDLHPLVGLLRSSRGADGLQERLAAEGVGYLLVNAMEVRRLNNSYRYLEMTNEETAGLNRLLEGSSLIRSDGDIHLFRLPPQ